MSSHYVITPSPPSLLPSGNFTSLQSTKIKTGVIYTDLTPSTVLVTDSTKKMSSSITTATELTYVHGVTSDIQTQLDSKIPSTAIVNPSNGGTGINNGTNTLTLTDSVTVGDTATVNQIMYSSTSNNITGLATGNNRTLITSGTGIPSISDTLPDLVQENITSLGTISNPYLNLTGSIRTSDGSAGAPAYSFGSDNNSGIYSPTGDTIGFSVASSNRMTLSDTSLTLGIDESHPMSIVTPNSTSGNLSGGNLSIITGTGFGNGTGGDINLTCGDASGTDRGGNINITAGNNTIGSGDAGDVVISGGLGDGVGNNGEISLKVDGATKLLVSKEGASKANVSIGDNVTSSAAAGVDGTALLISAVRPQSAFVFQGNYSEAAHKMVSFRNDLGEVGRIRLSAATTVYLTNSDARKKSNITDYETAVEDLSSIRIRNYNWNILPNEPQVGIIAQELDEVFPEYVDKSNPDNLMIETHGFIPYLIKAVQELKAEIEALKLLV
jgi:hypothetical protein